MGKEEEVLNSKGSDFGELGRPRNMPAQLPLSWREILIRDFGERAIDDFEKQRFLKQGFSTEKDYYKYLFNNFHKQTSQLLLFVNDYFSKYNAHIDYTAEVHQEIMAAISADIQTLSSWEKLDKKEQIRQIKKHHACYRNTIDYLAKLKIQHGVDGSPLVYAIVHHQKYHEFTLSLINSPNIDVNFSGLSTIKPIEKAVNENAISVIKALLAHPDIILNEDSSFIAFPTPEADMIINYYVLKNTIASKSLKLNIIYLSTKPNALLNYISSLVDETTDCKAQLDILENAIAIVDGQYASRLSEYLHVKGKSDLAVQRIQEKITQIKAQQAGIKVGASAASWVPTNTYPSYTLHPDDGDDGSSFYMRDLKEQQSRTARGLGTTNTYPPYTWQPDDRDDGTSFYMRDLKEQQSRISSAPIIIPKTPPPFLKPLQTFSNVSKYTLLAGLCGSAFTGILWLAGVARVSAPVWIDIGITLSCIAAVYLIVKIIQVYINHTHTQTPLIRSNVHSRSEPEIYTYLDLNMRGRSAPPLSNMPNL